MAPGWQHLPQDNESWSVITEQAHAVVDPHDFINTVRINTLHLTTTTAVLTRPAPPTRADRKCQRGHPDTDLSSTSNAIGSNQATHTKGKRHTLATATLVTNLNEFHQAFCHTDPWHQEPR